MKLYAVRIFVRDWEAVFDFYAETLGLPVLFKEAAIGWAEFDVGGAHFGLERVEPGDEDGEALVGRFLGVSLQVDDIDGIYQRLSDQGVKFTMAPERQPWGGTLAHFNDPEGNTITLLG